MDLILGLENLLKTGFAHWNQNLALLQPYKKKSKVNFNTIPKTGPPGGPIFGTARRAW